MTMDALWTRPWALAFLAAAVAAAFLQAAYVRWKRRQAARWRKVA